MQIQNNYDREVFNGDIGRVTEIDLDDRTLVVEFDSRARSSTISPTWMSCNYRIAVRFIKVRGASIRRLMVIPVHTQHFVMLQAGNLAVHGHHARGRKLVAQLVGSRKRAVDQAANTADTKKRYSLLKWRLQPKGREGKRNHAHQILPARDGSQTRALVALG